MNKFFSKIGQAITGRKGIGNTMTVAIIAAVVMLNILAYTVTSVFGLYLYEKDEEQYAISGNTDAIFESAIQLGKKVTITFCYTEDKLKTHDTGKLVLDTARAFEERYPEFIELRFINLLTKMDEDGRIVDFRNYSDVVCTKADALSGKKCNEVMRFIDLNKDEPRCRKCGAEIDLDESVVYDFAQSSVIFETGSGASYNYRVLTDKYTSAGFVDFYILDSSSNIVSYNGEEVMAAMISWVLNSNHKTVYLTQNHGETADVALSNLLTCAGYYVDVINLRRDEIPADAGMVIISNPTSDFERAPADSTVRLEIEKLDAYLASGGKVYVAFDPYVKSLPNLEALLKDWGIEISGSLTEGGVYVRDIVKENAMAITPDGYTFIATYADGAKADEIYGKLAATGTDRVLMSNVAKLDLIFDNKSAATVNPILISGPTSSTYAAGEATDTSGGYVVAAASTKTVGDKEATLFVLPTAYITATDAFISESYSNKDFLFSVYETLFDANPAPYGCNQILYDTQMLENLTMGRAKLYTALILAIPASLMVVGTVIIIKRKNR